jgi:hypothetical protein
MLDENEFLSPYGIRSLSKYHLDHPFVFNLSGQEYKVQYLPAESNTGMFGGNSNWRGPIWMPVNGLIIRGLLQMYPFYGPDFKVECPTGSGQYMTLFEVAKEIARRFSLVMGGPIFQSFRKAHLTGNNLKLLHRRLLVIISIAWLPMLVLDLVASRHGIPGRLSFLHDVEV